VKNNNGSIMSFIVPYHIMSYQKDYGAVSAQK